MTIVVGSNLNVRIYATPVLGSAKDIGGLNEHSLRSRTRQGDSLTGRENRRRRTRRRTRRTRRRR